MALSGSYFLAVLRVGLLRRHYGHRRVPLPLVTAVSRTEESIVSQRHQLYGTSHDVMLCLSANLSEPAGIWLGLRELGQLIGSSIQLSLNVGNEQRGKVGYSTYLVLIALQCLGLPLALLISPPEKLYRRDGVKIADPTKNKAVLGEAKKLWGLLKTKQFLLLIPVLVGFNWNNTYQGIYLTKYFSVRARTLGALTSGLAATAANVFWGWFYDLKRFSRPTLAKITWGFFAVFMLALFGWQVSNEKLYSETVPKITIDWSSPGFGRAFSVNVLFRSVDNSLLGK